MLHNVSYTILNSINLSWVLWLHVQRLLRWFVMCVYSQVLYYDVLMRDETVHTVMSAFPPVLWRSVVEQQWCALLKGELSRCPSYVVEFSDCFYLLYLWKGGYYNTHTISERSQWKITMEKKTLYMNSIHLGMQFHFLLKITLRSFNLSCSKCKVENRLHPNPSKLPPRSVCMSLF